MTNLFDERRANERQFMMTRCDATACGGDRLTMSLVR